MATRITETQAAAIIEARSELVFNHWKRIVSILTRSEARTISWVSLSLVKSTDKPKILSFKLPLSGQLTLAYKNFWIEAYRLGGSSVAEPIGDVILYTGKNNLVANAGARLAADRLVDHIERKLKTEWERSMTRRVDNRILVYQTELVFANFAGWDKPNAPHN